jgi:hypothetical protein
MSESKEFALLCLENPLLGTRSLNGTLTIAHPLTQEPIREKTFKPKGKKEKSLPNFLI